VARIAAGVSVVVMAMLAHSGLRDALLVCFAGCFGALNALGRFCFGRPIVSCRRYASCAERRSRGECGHVRHRKSTSRKHERGWWCGADGAGSGSGSVLCAAVVSWSRLAGCVGGMGGVASLAGSRWARARRDRQDPGRRGACTAIDLKQSHGELAPGCGRVFRLVSGAVID